MNVIHAGVQADSEALLHLPEMQKETLIGKKVLIIRGVGGREYLADNLRNVAHQLIMLRYINVVYLNMMLRIVIKYGKI